MRTGLLLLVVTLATCSFSRADEPAFSSERESVAKMNAIVERLETRIKELAEEVRQLREASRAAVIGGSLFDAIEPPPPGQRRDQPSEIFSGTNWGPLAVHTGTQVDQAGVIRNSFGTPVGHWGVDMQPVSMNRVPEPTPSEFLPFLIRR